MPERLKLDPTQIMKVILTVKTKRVMITTHLIQTVTQIAKMISIAVYFPYIWSCSNLS